MEAEELVLSMLEVERQLESPTLCDNQEALELEQDYDHLQLDRIIAFTASETIDENDPKFAILDQALTEADEALATFEAAYPEVALAASKCFGRSHQRMSQYPPTLLIRHQRLPLTHW